MRIFMIPVAILLAIQFIPLGDAGDRATVYRRKTVGKLRLGKEEPDG